MHQARVCSLCVHLGRGLGVQEQQLFREDLVAVMAEAQEDKPNCATNLTSLLVFCLLMFHQPEQVTWLIPKSRDREVLEKEGGK